ncbi:hypothetical protein MMC30_005371 [Trapelia coarctata]|nr:hypothetical protein [Trapelia coarctata]
MEANVITADIEKSNRTHQIEQVLSQHPCYSIPTDQRTTSGEDAPQVLPMEYSEDRRQGPQPVFGEEEKEVVSWSEDLQVVPLGEELALHPAIGDEEPNMSAGSDPGSLKDETTERRPVKRIVKLFVIAALMIIAAVVPITVFKHSQSAIIPVAATTNATSSIINAAPPPTATSTSTPQSPQSSPTPQTGMAIIYPENGDIMWLLYQDITGDIRLVRYTSSGIWQSTQSLPIKDVANQSSLTTVSYRSPSTGTIVSRLFYVDGSGTLQDIIQVGSTGPWTPGTLGTYQFKAPLVESLGMLGIVSYGTPFFSQISNTTNATISGVLSLFVGGMDGLVHEYTCFLQNDTWSTGYVFPGTNGYSEISVYTVQKTSLLLIFSDSGRLSQWYPCASRGLCTTQPWITGQTYNLTAFSNTSLSPPIGDFSYYQAPDMTIDFISLSSSVSGDITGDPLGMRGTSIVGGNFNTGGVNPAIGHVFFQSANGSIIVYGEGAETGLSTVWTNLGELPLG